MGVVKSAQTIWGSLRTNGTSLAFPLSRVMVVFGIAQLDFSMGFAQVAKIENDRQV